MYLKSSFRTLGNFGLLKNLFLEFWVLGGSDPPPPSPRVASVRQISQTIVLRLPPPLLGKKVVRAFLREELKKLVKFRNIS